MSDFLVVRGMVSRHDAETTSLRQIAASASAPTQEPTETFPFSSYSSDRIPLPNVLKIFPTLTKGMTQKAF